jgi:NADPH:quinone reductase-like Zn-dependent oxidoreductase
MSKPDAERLQEIAVDVTHGRLQSRVDAVVPFDDLPAVIERNRTRPQLGKTVVAFSL